MKATTIAHSNIALIKYWGKRDALLNLPAVGSISLTLSGLFTKTTLTFLPDLPADHLVINSRMADEQQTRRVSRFLDLWREKAHLSSRAEVVSENNFPTGAGLASSASAFASLALAANHALALNLTDTELSIMARRGSGSAARSIFGGFVEMKAGMKDDGSDSFAVSLAPQNFWDIRMLIVITTEDEKMIGSTDGMTITEKTSPYYPAWVNHAPQDLREMHECIAQRDIQRLGELAEYNCLKMHATALSARPPLLYWNHTTLLVMNAVQNMRKHGLSAYFTIDAGPQVKVICLPEAVESLKAELELLPGVMRVIATGPGPNASLLEAGK